MSASIDLVRGTATIVKSAADQSVLAQATKEASGATTLATQGRR